MSRIKMANNNNNNSDDVVGKDVPTTTAHTKWGPMKMNDNNKTTNDDDGLFGSMAIYN